MRNKRLTRVGRFLRRREGGVTAIELAVVMAILPNLAGMGRAAPRG